MKYNQPYGGLTDAPYVNGDPSIGRAGSIPPAEAIEYPQREIANFITDSAITPTNVDLRQLGKSIQSGKVIYVIDTGTVNAYSATLTPTPSAYTAGMSFRIKMLTTPTGPSTINFNALGAKNIIKSGGIFLNGGEWQANDIVSLTYDGTSFQLINSASNTSKLLSAPRDYFVSNTGSDSADGLTIGTAFATLGKAQATSQTFNQNGFDITIHVSNGTYAGPVNCGPINGSGAIRYVGNISTPANVLVSSSAGSAFVVSGASYFFDGVQVSSAAASGGDPGCGILTVSGGKANIGAVNAGVCFGHHFSASGVSQVNIIGPIRISGGAQAHLYSTVVGSITLNPLVSPAVTITTPVTFSLAFALADNLAVQYGVFGVITNPGNVTGKRYDASSNSIINARGNGPNHFPGTIAGTTSTGAQYL